jgi:hypothetical protein
MAPDQNFMVFINLPAELREIHTREAVYDSFMTVFAELT